MKKLLLLLALLFAFSACSDNTTDPDDNNDDGWIYWTAKLKDLEGAPNALFRMNYDNGKIEILANNAKMFKQPQSGKMLYRKTTDGIDKLYMANDDGTDEVMIETVPDNLNFFMYLLSPNAEKILYVQDKMMYSMNADGSGKEQITDFELSQVSLFSPDGNKIAYARKSDSTLNVSVYDFTSRESTTVFQKSIENDNSFYIDFINWSASGNKILLSLVFDDGSVFESHLYSINSDGSNPEELENCEDLRAAKYYANDSKILYIIDDYDSVLEMWTINADGSSQSKFSIPADKWWFFAHWPQKSDSEIFVLTDFNPKTWNLGNLLKVDLETGKATTIITDVLGQVYDKYEE